ncbi:ClpXP protease specificity-enhancing factor [Cycloclasticus pugetii]|jgi:stringent starvation protein B|uniref:ClpXP protease specificity-enhancing factor n=1 Tax=Cycloclasticus pugetii TaxID=34068 RepID=UPI00090F4E0A|nr:ClpXP protease specificity-enhancing factor [Cycloclasticus pugetii]SHI50858.1 stringent starvation protein B [Cycloclasticus pugetii]|tara:strand:- start:2998 stop:3387 length:390 start_codon:yes stop_codon:yes gene_type:complete
MTPLKPYLVRSLHEWILENGMTPYLLVDASYEGVIVPTAYVSDERIILNTKPSAVQNWFLDNEAISFSARFSGRSENLYIPINAVLATYAKENGKGMMFDERFEDDVPPDPDKSPAKKETKKPVLKIVK